MKLLPEWIDRIFARLQGVYGTQFTGKFSRVESGVDVGLLNAKEVWAEELGGFADKPEAIAFALKNLPSDFCPNAIEFRDLCRRAPKKEAPALAYTPTAEDIERARQASKAAAQAVSQAAGAAKVLHWATHPRSHDQLQAIAEAARKDVRFQKCMEQLVKEGIVSSDGRLLLAYRDGAFVKA